MNTRFKIPKPTEEEGQMEIVAKLLDGMKQQQAIIQELRDEIAVLKGQQKKPKIPKSKLEKPKKSAGEESNQKKKRAGSQKRKKKKDLPIHDIVRIPPMNIPEGSVFKGVRSYVFQDLIVKSCNTRYELEEWKTANGKKLIGEVPKEVKKHGHFGPTLRCMVDYLAHQCHVTQPLIHEALREWDVDISKGMVNEILMKKKESLHEEKHELLKTGLSISSYIQTDDTGARHQGKNGYCTHIGNEWFAWFESTQSKSRLNFLKLLRGENQDLILNQGALDYMGSQKLPKMILEQLKPHLDRVFADGPDWGKFLDSMKNGKPRHCQIVTEGAVMGSALAHGLSKYLVVVSDDAGQFNILEHALCWIHAERNLQKVSSPTAQLKESQEKVLDQVWEFYQKLKGYKENPVAKQKNGLRLAFDKIFTQKPSHPLLKIALRRIHSNKEELLRVLEYPEIPLHNNLSESDIREYVKRRKISGSTRSEAGKKIRDTFTSLKKTCRKLGVSFWKFLMDRTRDTYLIPPLSQLILQKADPITDG